ncbi:unnamed protein product [Closterium sp. Yama58-4]|nr:unnamed protein product [Closterium sp. Yama58-4]
MPGKIFPHGPYALALCSSSDPHGPLTHAASLRYTLCSCLPILPSHNHQVYYEKNYLDLPGKILQQWSYLWADNYTTAPYIAIIDDDVVFNLKPCSSGATYLWADNYTTAPYIAIIDDDVVFNLKVSACARKCVRVCESPSVFIANACTQRSGAVELPLGGPTTTPLRHTLPS